jgi:hypothetical protein
MPRKERHKRGKESRKESRVYKGERMYKEGRRDVQGRKEDGKKGRKGRKSVQGREESLYKEEGKEGRKEGRSHAKGRKEERKEGTYNGESPDKNGFASCRSSSISFSLRRAFSALLWAEAFHRPPNFTAPDVCFTRSPMSSTTFESCFCN